MNLSANYTLDELLKSQTADRLNIKEQYNPPQEVIECLRDVCAHILEPLHILFANTGTLIISSAYRSPEVNKAIGGANASQHTKGQAVDLELKSNGALNNILIAKTVLKTDVVKFDQMIVEFGTLQKPSWIHLSYSKEKQRGEILRAEVINGATHYSVLTKEQILAIV